MSDERRLLERAIAEITEIARGFGLDFYPMRFEICPADIIYTFGAYGMPTRFSHWSFGKAFHRMKLQYDLGLSRIYELVINSNPCYAFLLKGNSLIQNKLIVAHVLAHCDFFKNNVRFSNTSRNMVESMAASAERIRNYEMEYGKERVEQFLDQVLGVQEHIDPSLITPPRKRRKKEKETPRKKELPTMIYGSWIIRSRNSQRSQSQQPKGFPNTHKKRSTTFYYESQYDTGRVATRYSHNFTG